MSGTPRSRSSKPCNYCRRPIYDLEETYYTLEKVVDGQQKTFIFCSDTCGILFQSVDEKRQVKCCDCRRYFDISNDKYLSSSRRIFRCGNCLSDMESYFC